MSPTSEVSAIADSTRTTGTSASARASTSDRTIRRAERGCQRSPSPGAPVTSSNPAWIRAWQVVQTATSFESTVRPPRERNVMWWACRLSRRPQPGLAQRPPSRSFTRRDSRDGLGRSIPGSPGSSSVPGVVPGARRPALGLAVRCFRPHLAPAGASIWDGSFTGDFVYPEGRPSPPGFRPPARVRSRGSTLPPPPGARRRINLGRVIHRDGFPLMNQAGTVFPDGFPKESIPWRSAVSSMQPAGR